MKKLLFTALLAVSAGLSFANNGVEPVNNSATEVNAGENALIAKARKALKSSCPDAQGNLNVSVNVVSACFAGGFITEVSFWRNSPCPPNQICIQIVEVIGKVTFDCDNNVMGVSCGNAVEI